MIVLAWLLAGLGGIWLCWRMLAAFANAQPRQLISAAKLFAASFVAMASMGLLAFGRLGVVLALFGAVFLTAYRLNVQKRPPDPLEPGDSAEGESRIETGWLSMRLDRGSGEMSGDVKSGRFAGRALATLDLAELLALRRELGEAEPASLPLIDTWLDRLDPDWRVAGEAQGRRGGTATFHSDSMDEAMALDVLGLRKGAGRAEIEAAYRRVMAQVHPDKGGTDRLASLVNAARAFLLERA